MAVLPHSVSLTPSVSGHVQQGIEMAPLFILLLDSILGLVRQGKLLNGTCTHVMCLLKSPSGALQSRCLMPCRTVQAHAAVHEGGTTAGAQTVLLTFDTSNANVLIKTFICLFLPLCICFSDFLHACLWMQNFIQNMNHTWPARWNCSCQC